MTKGDFLHLLSDFSRGAETGKAFRVVGSDPIAALRQFPDFTTTFTYLDPGTTDERVSTIVYSSVLSGLSSVTKTYSYEGVSGSYRVSTIVVS